MFKTIHIAGADFSRIFRRNSQVEVGIQGAAGFATAAEVVKTIFKFKNNFNPGVERHRNSWAEYVVHVPKFSTDNQVKRVTPTSVAKKNTPTGKSLLESWVTTYFPY